MKKIVLALLISLLVMWTSFFGALATASFSSSSVVAEPEFVTFADPAIEAMVCESLGNTSGKITVAEAQLVTRLNLSNEWQRYISNEDTIHEIDGLETFVNLESLDLSFNEVTDITPLRGLRKLTFLSLGGNHINDIAPLAEFTSLKVLALSGCEAQDYSPLSKLLNLQLLKLDNSTLADVSPLIPLTNLKYLWLAGCPVSNYYPLADIFQGLEQKDFSIAFTLAELGFVMDDNGRQAIYDGEAASVRINHIEWGDPPEDWLRNCVRTVFTQDEYKIDIGYYPEFDAYVMLANRNGNLAMNYVYDHATDSFIFGKGDRRSTEKVVHALFPDAVAEDILLAPISIINDTIRETFSMTADALYAMPFEPPTLKSLGFHFATDEEGNTSYAYHEHEPHDMHISIFRPPWGLNADGRSIEFYDHDVNSYNLLTLYFADEGKYHIALFKDGADCVFNYTSDTKEYGWEYPDQDTVIQMFNGAFDTQGNDFYEKPIAHFEQIVRERFGVTLTNFTHYRRESRRTPLVKGMSI